MFSHLKTKISWTAVKPWFAVAGLFSAGALPCPGCGGPMILHFWPVAMALALRNFTRQRRAETDEPTQAVPDQAEKGSNTTIDSIQGKNPPSQPAT